MMAAEEEVDHDCDLHPFGSLLQSDELFQVNDDQFELRTDATKSSLRRGVRRDWGIPTFQDQMDRNICHFTMYQHHLDVLSPESGSSGYKNNNYNTRNRSVESLTIHLEHRANSTGSDLWDAALVLCHSIDLPGVLFDKEQRSQQQQQHHQQLDVGAGRVVDWTNATVLELGSGTGAVGMYISKFLKAKKVILTDLPENIGLIQRNIQYNNLHDNTQVVTLDWTRLNDLPSDVIPSYNCGVVATKVDFIVGSDLFLPYATHLLEPLARLLSELLALHPNAAALICYEERFDPQPFFKESAELCLSVTSIADDCLHPIYRDPGRIHMLRIRKEFTKI
ncbi:hypothetical protein ACA910_014240 [Epithemia clementina (nom. ined.)]